MLNSDTHSPKHLTTFFKEAIPLLKECPISKSLWALLFVLPGTLQITADNAKNACKKLRDVAWKIKLSM